jgi:hypothetical protein
MAIGKFHGVIRPHTPMASFTVIIRPRGIVVVVVVTPSNEGVVVVDIKGVGMILPPPAEVGRSASAA